MKTRTFTIAITLFTLFFLELTSMGQSNGDYRSKKSGDWKNKKSWQVFNNGSWGNTNQSPGNDNAVTVTIQSGHTVTFDQNKAGLGNLIVEVGGKLYRNSSSNENEIEICGDIICNGTIVNGSVLDALTLSVNGESTTISGNGECKFYSINKTTNSWSNTQLIIDMEVEATRPNGASIYNTKNNTNLEVIVNPGASLTPNGTIDLQNGNPDKTCSIYLKSDPTGYGSLITAGIEDSNAGNTTVERYLSQDKWHYITSPVENPAAQVFYDLYRMQFSETAGHWTYITDPAQVPNVEMEGIATWTASGMLGNTTLQFRGTINSGPKSIELSYTPNATHNNKGFNFVGNPYSSAVDWDYTGQDGWTKTHVDNAIYQWNGDLGVYGSYVNGFSVNQATNIIPAHQGFYVHCNQAGGELGINEGAQVHNLKPFFKSGKALTENVLRLATSGNGFTHETLVRFDDQATQNFDPALDALKILGSEEVLQLYSMCGSDIFSINAMNSIGNIALGFECSEAGIYTISWKGQESFTQSGNIMLQDMLTGTLVDMKEVNQYQFSHNPENSAHRFNVLFTPAGVEPNADRLPVSVYSCDNYLYINNLDGSPVRVEAFDMLGRNILDTKLGQGKSILTPKTKGYCSESLRRK